MNLAKETDAIIEIIRLAITGALTEESRQAWTVTAENVNWDFQFDCQLGDFRWKTQSLDFTMLPDSAMFTSILSIAKQEAKGVILSYERARES